MSETLRLEIVTPDHTIVSEDVDEVTANGVHGEFGVLKGHQYMIARLEPGEVRYHTPDGEDHFLAVSDGMAVVSSNSVSMLVSAAEVEGEIDVSRACASRRRAEERLQREHSESDLNEARAELALRRALVRIDFANRHPADDAERR